MDLPAGLSEIDMAVSVGMLGSGFGAKNLVFETFVYHSNVVASLIETAPPLGLEYQINLIHAH